MSDRTAEPPDDMASPPSIADITTSLISPHAVSHGLSPDVEASPGIGGLLHGYRSNHRRVNLAEVCEGARGVEGVGVGSVLAKRRALELW